MQNIKKYFMTLALLLTAVTGAWAQSSLNVEEFDVPAAWKGDENLVTAGDLPGFKASTKTEAEAWTGVPAEGIALLFYAFKGDEAYYVYFENGAYRGGVQTTIMKDGIFSLKSAYRFYYTASDTIELTPDADKKVWTLDKMPASNVELQVEYYPESNLFLSKEALADKANIVVKNGETDVAFDDDGKSTATVTEGNTVTAKFTGKKVLGMKVEKKAPALLSIEIGGHVTATIYYFEGETWEQAIQNHPEENSAWKINQGYISGQGANLFAGGNYVIVNPNDTIDPKADYHLWWT